MGSISRAAAAASTLSPAAAIHRRKTIKAMRHAGWTYKAIGKVWGITPERVSTYLHKWNAERFRLELAGERRLANGG